MPKNVVPFKITDEDTGSSWNIFIPVELNRIAPYHFISSNWNWSIGEAEGHENTWFGYPGDFTSNPSSMMSYNVSDLQENFIEISRDYEIKGDTSGAVKAKTVKFGDQMTVIMSLWREAVSTSPLVEIYSMCFTGPTNTVFNAVASRSPSLQASYPKTLTGIPDEVLAQRKPALSFHICNYRWEAGYYDPQNVPVLIVNYWTWANEGSSEEPNWVYKIEYQWCMSATYAFGDGEIVPQDLLTPSTTPNSTPNGGMGPRQITPRVAPFTSASQLAALGGGYAGIGQSGIHLYKLSPANWEGVQQCIWNKNLIIKSMTWTESFLHGAKSDLAEYLVSNYIIGIPIDVSGVNGYVQIGTLTLDVLVPAAVTGESLSNRFVDGSYIYEFDINNYSDTFLDYDPMTKIQVHIPYCGNVSVSPDQCMGGKIQVKYIVDLATGNCVAQVRAIDRFGTGVITNVIPGQCGTSRAMISNDTNMQQLFGAISSIATGATTGTAIGLASGAAGFVESAAPQTKIVGSSKVGGLAAVMGELAIYVAVYHPQDITGLEIGSGTMINQFGNKVGYAASSFCKVSEIRTGEYIEAIVNPNVITTATDAEKDAIRSVIQKGVYI